ncbi:MAG: hypothetical protein IPI39_10360 [Candidatus Obscuribacter sp.]|nr:hypothetical protein [Candidatus Obscuribacter sp.]
MFSTARYLTRNVKRWSKEEQMERWLAASLLQAEKTCADSWLHPNAKNCGRTETRRAIPRLQSSFSSGFVHKFIALGTGIISTFAARQRPLIVCSMPVTILD